MNENNFGLMTKFQEYSRDELHKLEECYTNDAKSDVLQENGDLMKITYVS